MTLYVIIISNSFMYKRHSENVMTEIRRLFREKLALIPDTKLVIANNRLANVWPNNATAHETLEVRYFVGDILLVTMLEHLEKRWQTLDLISVMQEVKRTLASSHAQRRFPEREEVEVRENLSCIPRLQKVDKSLEQVVSKQE